MGSVFDVILSFTNKDFGFVAEPSWALIVFVTLLTGILLTQKVKTKKGINQLVFMTH